MNDPIMRFKLRTLLIVLALTCTSGAWAGNGEPSSNGGRGGGDSLSKKIRLLWEQIGADGKNIRPVLLEWLKNFRKIESQGKTPALLRSLLQRGLEQDIQLGGAPYVILGFEESQDMVDPSSPAQCWVGPSAEPASTLTMNIDLEGGPRPAICIDLRRLAEDGTQTESLVGLLMHEHARHFGQDDTVNTVYHPIADFVESNFKVYGETLVGTRGLPGQLAARDSYYLDFFYDRRLYSSAREGSDKYSSIRVTRLDGYCEDLSVDYLSDLTPVYPRHERVKVGKAYRFFEVIQFHHWTVRKGCRIWTSFLGHQGWIPLTPVVLNPKENLHTMTVKYQPLEVVASDGLRN